MFLVCKKGEKEDKSEFAAKSVGIIVTISSKNIFQIASKTFSKQCVFTDCLNENLQIKQYVERPQQILASYGGAVAIVF